jgi:hypothetical protein
MNNLYSHIDQAKEALNTLSTVKRFKDAFDLAQDITQGRGIILVEQKTGKGVYRLSFGAKRDAGTWFVPRIIPVAIIGKLEEDQTISAINHFNEAFGKKVNK